jgi:hypothetical protein
MDHLMKHHHHSTLESERPKSIRFGDITSWSRATTSFVRPTCKGKGFKTKSSPVTNLDALRRSVVNAERPIVTSTPVCY